ncbi:hypothetical protein FB639_003431, partial [Coemansia asiatica]
MSIFNRRHNYGGRRIYNSNAQPGYVEPAQYEPGVLQGHHGGHGAGNHYNRPERVKVVKEKRGGCMPFLCGM